MMHAGKARLVLWWPLSSLVSKEPALSPHCIMKTCWKLGKQILVTSRWFQPIWKISQKSNWIISPSRDENKKIFETTPQWLHGENLLKTRQTNIILCILATKNHCSQGSSVVVVVISPARWFLSQAACFFTEACGLQVVFSSLKVAKVKIWTVDDMWWYTLIQTRRYTGTWGMVPSHLPCASRASRITSSRLRWLESSTGDGSQSLTYDSETMLSCAVPRASNAKHPWESVPFKPAFVFHTSLTQYSITRKDSLGQCSSASGVESFWIWLRQFWWTESYQENTYG